jgi:hypothetical protein
MGRPANPHDSREVSQRPGPSPTRTRSERALQLAQAINPGLAECITLGTTERQLPLFQGNEGTAPKKVPQ